MSPGPLQEQPVPLAAEPPFQLLEPSFLMALQCFENDIYLKLLLKLHICLKQHFIYMLNQELDVFSALLNHDLKSRNRNAVH